MRKAIVVVSFGTSYIDALEKSILKVENRIAESFEGYDVFRAFTSNRIIKKLKQEHDMDVKMPGQVLEILHNKRYDEVLIQPLHIIPGEEFEYIKEVKNSYNDKFKKIELGRPIFCFQGVEGLPQDYSLFIKSISDLLDSSKTYILVGHGTDNPANTAYGCLQTVLEDEGYGNVYVGTVMGYPTLNNIIDRINKKNIKEVTLIPLMLVAGWHVLRDIFSEDNNSWKSILEDEGIKVKCYIHGLAEFDKFNQLYIDRISQLIEGKYVVDK